MTTRLVAFAMVAGLCIGAAAEPVKLDRARCPVMPAPQISTAKLPDGIFLFTARFMLRADGGIEQIKVEGEGPERVRLAIAAAICRYECLPAEAGQDIESEFEIKIS